MRNQPALANWRMRPVSGGWGPLEVRVAGHTHVVHGQTPGVVATHYASLLRNNGEFKSMRDVWDRLNTIWCAREPARCPAAPEPVDHRATVPAEYGPALWASLSVFGMAHDFDKTRWLAAVEQVTKVLDPAASPKTGCGECHGKWVEWLNKTPADGVDSPSAAAAWVWRIHDIVNQKLNKPRPTFIEAARMWAWDVDV